MFNSLHLPFDIDVDIVRSGCSHLRAGTYAGQFDSKLPSYALESSCIQIRFSVGLSAVLLLYLRLVVAPMISWCFSGVSLGHFRVQCHVWRRRFCLILFRL